MTRKCLNRWIAGAALSASGLRRMLSLAGWTSEESKS